MTNFSNLHTTGTNEPVRVLIADDDPSIARVLQRLLALNGYNSATVENGREALRYLPGSKIELVITDILMPEVDGYELIPKLRKTQPGIRILAMTGNAPQFSFDMHRTARMLGADRVIGKPFELTEIIRMVKELLAKTETPAAVTPAQGTTLAG